MLAGADSIEDFDVLHAEALGRVVDTGATGSGSLLENALHHVGRSLGDIRQIVLTHFHEDHTGSATEVAGWAGARVIARARQPSGGRRLAGAAHRHRCTGLTRRAEVLQLAVRLLECHLPRRRPPHASYGESWAIGGGQGQSSSAARVAASGSRSVDPGCSAYPPSSPSCHQRTDRCAGSTTRISCTRWAA